MPAGASRNLWLGSNAFATGPCSRGELICKAERHAQHDETGLDVLDVDSGQRKQNL
jgi:hypothetical protein